MLIDTAVWSASSGWSPELPVPDGRSSLVLAFGGSRGAGAPIDAIHELARAWRGSAILGCSGGGQILGDALHDDALAVTVARFDRTTVRHSAASVAKEGSARRATRLVAQRLADPALKGAIVFADGRGVNGNSVAMGFADVVPALTLGGGLAGSTPAGEQTWTIVDGTPTSGWVSAVGFVGDDVAMGTGTASGWRSWGPELLVTKSYGNLVYELDEMPAITIYERHVGRLRDSGHKHFFPLVVRDLDDRTVLRTVIGVDRAQHALRFAGDIAQGSTVRWTHARSDALVHAAAIAAKKATSGSDELALAVSCSARRSVLGGRSADELEAVTRALGPASRVVGFYGHGALTPVGGMTDLVNQSMTITTICERAA